MHDGWVYAVIIDGRPNALVGNTAIKTRAGTVIIFHPDCAYGWSDRPGRSSRIMTWLWRTPPTHSALQPEPGSHILIQVKDTHLHKLIAVNKECSRQVAVPGEIAFLALRRARLDMDICIAAALGANAPVDPRYRINLALQYLKHNPAELQPGNKLCEYLQVSPATLRLLFQKQCGRSPQVIALELRMNRARELLKSGRFSIKEIAHQLGYQHANDFSRAFKRFFGRSARASRPY